MTETIIHIVSGEVVLNPEPRPTEADYTWFTLNNAPTFHEYKFTEALAEWKKNCIPCENDIDGDIIILGIYEPTLFTPGQKVLADNNKVIKIL